MMIAYRCRLAGRHARALRGSGCRREQKEFTAPIKKVWLLVSCRSSTRTATGSWPSHDYIDFIDTYSAAFRRDRFLEMTGYDTSFPLACAEDIELSYRMSARGWKMKFAPNAVVYHTHPDTLSKYLKKKYKFAFWRVLAVRKNPGKAMKDSHTPQLMKLQLLFAPALAVGIVFDLVVRPAVPASGIVLAAFLVSTLPYALRAIRKDPVVGLLSPALLAARACAQVLGVTVGLIYGRRKPAAAPTKSPA